MPVNVLTENCPRCGSLIQNSFQRCSFCAPSFPTSPTLQGQRTKRVGVFFFVLLVGVALVALISTIAALSHLVTSSGAYKQAITIAKSSPEVRNALGDNVRPLFPAIGFASSNEGEEFTEFSLGIAGSRARGHLYGVANSIHGKWEFSRLSLRPDFGGGTIDLAPMPSTLSLPNVPQKKVYLIPADLDSSESLEWAPKYYKAKLGIDVEVLSAASIPNDLEDMHRGQIDADAFLDRLRRMYPALAADPANILVAVTSRDIFLSSRDWAYAENCRAEDRFAVVSSARLRPIQFLDRWNPEWLNSRLQKMLTKNVAMLYFDLPMSSDYTSLLSGGVLSGSEVDLMSGSIIGAEGRWDPFIDSGEIGVTLFNVPGKPLLWKLVETNEVLAPTSAHSFSADLTIGLFISRQVDFVLDDPLRLTRVYRNKDPMPRAFGVGANDSMDIFLAGQMGHYIDLIFEDGGRLRFTHAQAVAGKGDTYQAEKAPGNPFSGARAIYRANNWTIERKDGWKFYFPFRPHALPIYVTVLTGFSDPAGHNYEMERSESGDLLSVTAPLGAWLHFDRDSEHRVRSITASTGRTAAYRYDAGGRLSNVIDSDGNQDHYEYDDKSEMISISVGSDAPILTNTYDISGNITSQTLTDGSKFEYHYTRDINTQGSAILPDLITAPNGLMTYIEYNGEGYRRSLPSKPFQYN